MSLEVRPFRSALYLPASNSRALEKAKDIDADAIIFDLEDAVAPSEKESARDALAQKLSDTDYGRRTRLVRINGFDTPWGVADLEAFASIAPEGILMPKVATGAQAINLAAKMDALGGFEGTRTWAMIESPEGVLNSAAIAVAPRMAGFVMGTNDLAKDLRARPGADRSEIATALQFALLAARAAGIVAIDGVYNAFKDEEGLVRECLQGRDMGFDGKSLIHPAQVGPTNKVFSPSEEDIVLAQRQIDAFEAAMREGKGVAVLDGSIVENLHVETAKSILAIARATGETKG